jgi:oligopeptidase B
MNIPKLKQLKCVKKYHGIELNDDYSWVDQSNILDVLKDSTKLLPDVREYIEKNNNITEDYFADVTNLQKKTFQRN